MKKLLTITNVLRAGLVLFAFASAPHADAAVVTVMDQIGSSGAFFNNAPNYRSEADSSVPTYNEAAVDDFSAPSVLTLTRVEAVIGAFDHVGFGAPYEVNVYSSLAAANANLNGDVAHVIVSAGAATVTTPFNSYSGSALVSLPVNIFLSHPGTFYLSVVSDSGGSGFIAEYGSTGLVGSNPGGTNGYVENPGGGQGFTGNQLATSVDFAYRLTGTTVPEPSTWAFLLGGVGVIGFGLFRRARA